MHALPNSRAQKRKNNLGLRDKQQVEEIFSKLLDTPNARDNAIVLFALQQVLTENP